MKALETGKQGEARLEYRPFDGFYVSVDFVLNLPRNFERVYVTYQLISPSSEEQFPEIKTAIRHLESAGPGKYRIAVAEKHRFYSIPANDHSYLMFKFWVEETFVTWDPKEFDDLLAVNEEQTDSKPLLEDKRFVIYGWTPFKVFYKKKVM